MIAQSHYKYMIKWRLCSRDGQLTGYWDNRDYFIGNNQHHSINDNQNWVKIVTIEEFLKVIVTFLKY